MSCRVVVVVVVAVVLGVVLCGDVEAKKTAKEHPLVQLFHECDGSNWVHKDGWLHGTPCDDKWYGVTCEKDSRGVKKIVKLHLPSNRLVCPFPAGISEIHTLGSIDFSNNFLTGPIPESLANLTGLWNLEAPRNLLVGPLPSWFDTHRAFVNLILHDNMLSGELPTLKKATRLHHLSLSNNLFEGTLPPRWGEFKLLKCLWLSHNFLEGPVPPEWKEIERMTVLALDHNLFETLDDVLVSLHTKTLRLNDNQLKGPIPPRLAENEDLIILRLENNELEGPIPAFREEGTPRLSVLHLENNVLTGMIPPFDKDLQFTDIDLSGNALSGPIPSLNEQEKLAYFRVHNNPGMDELSIDWNKDPLHPCRESTYLHLMRVCDPGKGQDRACQEICTTYHCLWQFCQFILEPLTGAKIWFSGHPKDLHRSYTPPRNSTHLARDGAIEGSVVPGEIQLFHVEDIAVSDTIVALVCGKDGNDSVTVVAKRNTPPTSMDFEERAACGWFHMDEQQHVTTEATLKLARGARWYIGVHGNNHWTPSTFEIAVVQHDDVPSSKKEEVVEPKQPKDEL